MGTPKDSIKTKAKIIDAAGPLFTQRGFKGVTVREIAKDANVHLGALNYHFRTKNALYRDVLLEACNTSVLSDKDQEALLALDPEEALFQIIKTTLDMHRKQTVSHWQNAILSRECWNPSDIFEEVTRKYFKPQSEFVAGIIAKIVNKSINATSVQFAEISMLGLVESFGLYRNYTDAVAPGLSEYGIKNDWLAKKITLMVITAAKEKR